MGPSQTCGGLRLSGAGAAVLLGLLVPGLAFSPSPSVQRLASTESCRTRPHVLTMDSGEPNVWQRISNGLRKAAVPVFIGFSSAFGPSAIPMPARADSELRAQLEALNKQVLMQNKLLQMGRMERRLPAFPTVKNGVRLEPAEVKNSIERIKVLQAYLDEVELDIEGREWKYVPGFLGVVGEQEDAFIKLIEALYPTESVADRSSRDALSYEAQNLYLELDNLREAAKFQRQRAAQRAYSKIALAYDRFLKAGDLYAAYDPITSTEPFYQSIPQNAAIKYDNGAKPEVTDQIVVLGGPDKGKTGKLIGIDDAKAVIKLDTNGKFTEVKIISMTNIGKQLTE